MSRSTAASTVRGGAHNYAGHHSGTRTARSWLCPGGPGVEGGPAKLGTISRIVGTSLRDAWHTTMMCAGFTAADGDFTVAAGNSRLWAAVAEGITQAAMETALAHGIPSTVSTDSERPPQGV